MTAPTGWERPGMESPTDKRRLTAVLALVIGGCVPWAVKGESLLANGDFSQSRTGWDLVASNGAAGQLTIDADDRLGAGPCAGVVVQRRATLAGWELSLRTRVGMRAGRRYRVRFAVGAAEAGTAEICLQRDSIPLRILLLAELSLGPRARTYEFVTDRVLQDSDMRLGFWFGASPPGTYWVDSVAVDELTPGESAALERVPQGFSNGTFDAGTDGWTLLTRDDAKAALAAEPTPKLGDGPCARVTVTRSTDVSYHVQLMQIFQAEKGKAYVATLSAAAERDVETVAHFQAPPPVNRVFASQKLTLGPKPSTHTLRLARADRDGPMKLTIHLSRLGEGVFWVDNVSLVEEEAP